MWPMVYGEWLGALHTLFRIGGEYGLHESSAQRVVVKIEGRLIGSDRSSLLLA